MVLHALRNATDALQNTYRIIYGNKFGGVIHDREFSDIFSFCRAPSLQAHIFLFLISRLLD